MHDSNKKIEVTPESIATSITPKNSTKIRLSELCLDPDRFIHRDPRFIEAATGLHCPIEVAPRPDGRFVIVRGHRRVQALRHLCPNAKVSVRLRGKARKV